MYYDRHIFVCDNQRAPDERKSCGLHNAGEILRLLKSKAKASGYPGKLRVQRSGCLDRCELGPVQVSYPEGEWFSLKNPADVDRFLQEYLGKDNLAAIEDLRLSQEREES